MSTPEEQPIPFLEGGDIVDFHVHTTQEIAAATPFPPEIPSASFQWPTDDINVTQLCDELSAAVGEDVFVVLANPQPQLPVSMDNPAWLHYSPPLPQGIVREVLVSHVADPDYNADPEVLILRGLQRKALNEDPFTQDEVHQAVRILLKHQRS